MAALPTQNTNGFMQPLAAGSDNYLIIPSASNAGGVLSANFRYVLRATTCGNNADIVPSLNVAIHYFACDSATLPANATAVATWSGNSNDLVPNRIANSGYTYLRTASLTMQASYKPQTQAHENSSVIGDTVFEAKAENYIPALTYISAGNRLRIIAVLVVSSFVNTAVNQAVDVNATVNARSA